MHSRELTISDRRASFSCENGLEQGMKNVAESRLVAANPLSSYLAERRPYPLIYWPDAPPKSRWRK